MYKRQAKKENLPHLALGLGSPRPKLAKSAGVRKALIVPFAVIMKLTFPRKVNVLIYGAVSLLLYYRYFIKNKVKTPKQDFINQRSPNKQSSVSKVDFTVKGLRALADIGLISVQNIKRRNYDVNSLEDLYNLEPSSKSEMKERVSKAVFLSSRVNFDDYTSLHYIDLGARTYSSSILWLSLIHI